MFVTDDLDKLLMIPGPTPVERSVLAALAEPTMSHTSPAVAAIVARCLEGVRTIAHSPQAHTFVFGGAGTLAQEAAVVNLVAPGERVLVASNGYFGDRFVPICHAHGIEVDHLTAPWGTSVTPDQLREALRRAPARAVTITHVDTSTGVLAPVRELTAAARDAGALVIVDAVCSFGGVPLPMDDWGVDVVLTGAQKALGVPPGLAILLMSARALARRRELPRVAAYYADLLNWQASMHDPTVYFSTHAVNLFYALKAAVELIEREGLERRYARHDRLSTAFRAGMKTLGFGSLADEPFVAPTLSVLAYPDGVDDMAFRGTLAEHGVIAAGCLGDFKGRGVRFGHMGNISDAEIFQSLAAIEASLLEIGHAVQPGTSLFAARAVMAEELAAAPAGI